MTSAKPAAPATYRAAVKRLQRSVVGKAMALDRPPFQPGLMQAMPIAWAISTLAEPSRVGSRTSIVVVRDEVSENSGLRWYSLVPRLLGDHEHGAVSRVLAGAGTGQFIPEPHAMKAQLAQPRFEVLPAHVYARSNPAPSTIVFCDVEFRGANVVADLMHDHMGSWLESGTEIILIANTQAAIALVMEAIVELGGQVSDWALRSSSALESMVPMRVMSAACRVLKVPTRKDRFAAVAKRLSAEMDVLAETWFAGEDESFHGYQLDVGTVRLIPMPSQPEPLFSIILPLNAICMQTPELKCAYVMMADRFRIEMGVRDEIDPDAFGVMDVLEEDQFSDQLLSMEGPAGALARYRASVKLYLRYVDDEIETALGIYRDDGAGQLVECGVDEFDDFDFSVLLEERDDEPTPSPTDNTPVRFDELPSVDEARAAATRVAEVDVEQRDVETSPHEPLSSHDISDTPLDLDLLEALRSLRRELADTQHRLAEVELENERLRAALQHAGAAGSTHSDLASRPSVPVERLPSTWDELFTWAHKEFDDKVAFTSRARRAARKSAFSDIPVAAQAIRFLAQEYRNVRTNGDEESRKTLRLRGAELGFAVGPVGAAVRAHGTADTYTATHEGKRYPLDLHLQGSSARDESRGLRVYFSWLPASGQVLVGHLPSHLRNTLT